VGRIRSPSRPEGYVAPRPARDRYDPQARLWPVLKALLLVYRLLCVGRVHVAGRERIPRGGCIVVSNHAFVSDAFVLAIVFGRVHGLAQAESFTLPLLGWLLARAGQIPVGPGRREEVLERARDLLRRGETILIYPEGQLSHGGELLPGKTGAARLALRTGAPILPVGTYAPPQYGRAIHSRHYNRPTVGIWQVGGPAYIAIGDPWRPFAGRTAADEDELRQATDDVLRRIRAQVEQARAMAG